MNPATAAAFALQLAATAKSETLPRFNASTAVENKASAGAFDPVTEADRAAERAMRDLIERSFPDHGICGEEWADREGASGFTWSLDPIDGTRSYICGLPTWTTLIALLEGGAPTVGLIDVPCLGETYLAAGDSVILIRNDSREAIRTSDCQRVADARFSTTDPFLFAQDPNPLQPILDAVQVSRFGHDAYAYARLAAGSIDLVIEAGLKPHDYNALIPIVRGAGGHFGDWRGGNDFTDGAVIAAASRGLYEEAVALLSA